MSTRLKLTEVFYSLQGEADSVGIPTVFIRLTGCPLRCQYCDTAYAFHGGQWCELEALMQQVASYGTRYVCVTGGGAAGPAGLLDVAGRAGRRRLPRLARDQRGDAH